MLAIAAAEIRLLPPNRTAVVNSLLMPLLALPGLGSSAAGRSPVLLGLFVVGAAAVAVFGLRLVRSGLGADPGALPPRLLALGWGTALATAAAGVLAFRDGSPDAVGWSVALPAAADIARRHGWI